MKRVAPLLLLGLVGMHELTVASEPAARLFQAAPSAELSAELLSASDLTLTQSAATFRLAWTKTEAALAIGLATIAVDYAPVPFDFLGRAVELQSSTPSFQFELKHRLGARLELLAGAGGREGFDSYRALWLDEYFRQRFATLAGYRRADPRGVALSVGARWEYLPGSGFVQLGYSRAQDDVAPGYEIDFDGLRRGQGTLATDTVALAFENVVTPRLRTKVEMRLIDTSGRELRVGAEASANYAIAERWIARVNFGYSDERPTFRANFGGVELEFAMTESFAAFAGVHAYRDTGEIENALLFTSAAPGLDSRRGEIGVRRDGTKFSWRVTLGTVESDFAATNPATDFFQNLYRDRHWLTFRAAGSRRF